MYEPCKSKSSPIKALRGIQEPRILQALKTQVKIEDLIKSQEKITSKPTLNSKVKT